MAQGRSLINNGTATGALADWPGGQGVFMVVATSWNGATIKLQFQGPDGATMIDAGTAATLTANGAGVFYLPPGKIQGVVVGGPPTGVYATAARVEN